MRLDIDVHLHYTMSNPTDLLLQIEAADLADQKVISRQMLTDPVDHFIRVTAEDGLGERAWLRCDDALRCNYTAQVLVDRPRLDLAPLGAVPPHLLPGDTVRYLMPSRYCPSDEFQTFVASEFGGLQGGALIKAMRDWLNHTLGYVPGVSGPQTTALDTFVQRQGVCRDFAHLMVCFARAAAIPARFVSVYAPDVTPQDFHAVAEVYLDGTWHLVDATGMAPADTIARIGVGMDAAEVSFLTSYGPIGFLAQTVNVTAHHD
ncbi:transglutaminase family protein [Cognatishimia sp. MH4019]|uniref:transglutaminase-like domain-containing protein n=1 Tax=Cognatishimia sp. MH4019 TaxID=2854030 RepID=UPI001CD60A0F|nr:transglutaminase family protein [Cognatishimia sp. MH4019]